ncbi:MAG: YdaU family protein [Burkholderiales bacterium]|jgi:uncharacterized protein YdaU (DUF1376 family)|uniref:YdaU family protein n=1 Tax=unclassified Microcystis TaxID=2643300 RepID=UPI0025844A59|nr:MULTISPECIES: YdaU family protein [unclassified Microcystis]MCA2926873.1 YdaU family protein [Microcystis sp. M020S1]MCA2935610.1 YdaU family protein [Microcystis sp. M015S1]MCA3159270.1 YdaU family protein [Burkholderiales bacterium]MCA2932068.1 YdaU family protein [Microcystis sp. M018S1]MCA2954772.1 YdaU family protein [Microcystis sp. M010S1]
MHYFKRNIGDYHKKAGRLSMLEHGAYTLLMDACYDREQFPTIEQAYDWCWARTDQEKEAVRFVLEKFFTENNGVYFQSRIQDEIDKYHENSSTNARIAKEREEKRRTNRERTVNEQDTNLHLTTNHKPITNIKDKDTTYLSDRSRDAPLRCPVEKLVDLYHKALPTCPQVAVMTKTRQAYAASRWREVCQADSWETESEGLEFFESYFLKVAESKFLIGSADGRNGKVPFRADFEWLMRPNNFAKVLEGKYHR